jgi:hypothetical protein
VRGVRGENIGRRLQGQQIIKTSCLLAVLLETWQKHSLERLFDDSKRSYQSLTANEA